MKQGRMLLALALVALVAAAAPAPQAFAAVKKPAATATAKKRTSLRQFTGVVTAIDKTSLTVEKTGKAAKSMTFSRHAEMRTTGDLAKDARVTVYWKDEAGRPIAHKVVVKADAITASR